MSDTNSSGLQPLLPRGAPLRGERGPRGRGPGAPSAAGAPSPAGSAATAAKPRPHPAPACGAQAALGETRLGGLGAATLAPAASGRSARPISEGFHRPGRRRGSGSRGRGRGDRAGARPLGAEAGSAAPARARDSETFLFGACLLRGCVGHRRDGRLGKVFLK